MDKQDPVLAKVLFEILPKFAHAVYSAKTCADIKAPSLLLFSEMIEAVFTGDKVEVVTNFIPNQP
jgi:hypothetical protein